jgi:hypothetical protein
MKSNWTVGLSLAVVLTGLSGNIANASVAKHPPGSGVCNGIAVPCKPPKPHPKPCNDIGVPCTPKPRPCPTLAGTSCLPCPGFAPCKPGKPGTSDPAPSK